jgi:hypothetical protein
MRLNRTAKQAFYNARKRSGDTARLAEMSGYSESHIRNVLNGYRNVTDELASAFYNISRRRMKNSQIAA